MSNDARRDDFGFGRAAQRCGDPSEADERGEKLGLDADRGGGEKNIYFEKIYGCPPLVSTQRPR